MKRIVDPPEVLELYRKLGIKPLDGVYYEPGEGPKVELTAEMRERFERFMGCAPEQYFARQESSARKHPSSKPRRAKNRGTSRSPARGRKRKHR